MRRHYKVAGLITALFLIVIGAVGSSARLRHSEWFYELCGVERWSVKTGTDADAGKVNLTPQVNTIATLIAFPAQANPPANNRVSPYETQVYQIDATLVEYKSETDQDYHLVIKDASGNTMIAEIPDPSCIGSGSPFLAGVTNARAQMDAKYSVSSSFQTANIPVRITGCGMFDFAHGQTGAAPNQIELHPVINIIFNPGSGSAPAAPTGLSAVGGTGQIALSWTASTGASSYNIYRSNTTGTETSYKTGITTASYTDTGLTAATKYYYQVTAVNTSGESAKSSEASATTTSSGTAPPAPTGLTAGGGTGQIALSWTASTGATAYNIYRSNSTGTETSYLTGIATTSTIDKSVSASTTYYYKVTAVNATGESPKSNEASATTAAAGSAPSAPTNLVATAGSAQIALTWTASTGATTYNIYRSNTTGTETSYKTGIAVTTYTDSSLTNGTAYYYKVTAVNATGESPKSNEATATPTGGVNVMQLLGNPGFENGNTAAPWVVSSGVINNGGSEPAHSGSWDAFLCGYSSAHTDTLYQQVAIPAGTTTATLSFWLHIDTARPFTNAADTLTLQIRNSAGTVLTTLDMFSNLDANTGFTQQTYDVSAYVGQTIQIYLVGVQTSTVQTSFVVDDFALNVAINTVTATGSIALEGVSNLAAISAGAPLGTFHISFRTPGTTAEIKGSDVTLTITAGSASGTYSVPGVTPGTYDVNIKGAKNLSVTSPGVVITSSAAAVPNVTLPAGDSNNDNRVDTADFNAVAGAFGNTYSATMPNSATGYDPTADFTFDGLVSTDDFNLLVGNFGNSGS